MCGPRITRVQVFYGPSPSTRVGQSPKYQHSARIRSIPICSAARGPWSTLRKSSVELGVRGSLPDEGTEP